MEKLTAMSFEECPKHKGEFLSMKNLIIKYPQNTQGFGHPFFNYCEKENKFYNGKEFVSKEEIALEFVNEYYKRKYLIPRIFKGKYKLSEIEVIDFDELVK